MNESTENRRPIAQRSSGWAKGMAKALAASGVSANAISVASVVFAAIGAAALLAAPLIGGWLYLVTAICVPLRLVANLLDGMVAVEHGRATPTGPIFNEVPDRIADVLFLAAAGHAAEFAIGGFLGGLAALTGWVAAVAALLTAYVRELGRALGSPADFSGPFAKQQRMWVVGAAALLASFLPSAAGVVLFAAVALIAVGTSGTAARRLAKLSAFLKAEAQRTTESEGEGRTSSPRTT